MRNSTNTYSTALPEMEFFPLDPEEISTRGLDAPVLEQEWFSVLARERMVIIGGPDTEEKHYLAQHLAWQAAVYLQNEGCIRQRRPAASLVRLPALLGQSPRGTVFLLEDLEPHHLVGYGLERFLELLRSSDQYVVVTTESGPAAWGASEWVRQHVWKDPSEISYPTAVLAERLLGDLQDVGDELPAELAARLEGSGHDAILAGELTLLEVAGRLGSPSRVSIFARALCRQDEITEATVREKMGRVVDPGHHASRWYLQLGPREQNLVLGLSLLDGLLDDQVFAALEMVVRQVWRQWEPDFCQYDYHELPEVSAYYTPPADFARAGLIECRPRECREAFIETAWRFHRRRILATLPTLVGLVRDAPWTGSLGVEPAQEAPEDSSDVRADGRDDAADNARSWWSDDEARASRWHRYGRRRDLFGSPLRSRLLCEGVANLLSLLGRLAPDSVEPLLLDMAADERRTVQHVAALALAQWRSERDREAGDKRLYRILSAWENEAKIKELTRRVWRQESDAEPFARVRATIALTVGRAALYDRPNQLDERLVNLFQRLLRDSSPVVQASFESSALPLVMAGHLVQVEPALWGRALLAPRFRIYLTIGMALVHQARPAEARKVLESWRLRAGSIPETDPDAPSRKRRTSALAVIALTCGLLEPAEQDGGYGLREIFDILQGLLADEADREVRSAALRATVQQARTDLRKVAAPVQELVTDFTLGEREYLVSAFEELYLEQRRSLASESPPGTVEHDAWVKVDGVTYPLWIESQRPWTQVEEVLREWLDDPGHPAAIQLAVECMGRFAATALEVRERQLIDGLDEGVGQGEEPLVAVDTSGWSRLRRLSPLGHLVVWMAAPLDAHRRDQLRAAFPEYLMRKASSPAEADRMLRRLREDPANAGLTRSLGIAAWIHALRWLWLPVGLALAVALALALALA